VINLNGRFFKNHFKIKKDFQWDIRGGSYYNDRLFSVYTEAGGRDGQVENEKRAE
jgi:hypothetical protein